MIVNLLNWEYCALDDLISASNGSWQRIWSHQNLLGVVLSDTGKATTQRNRYLDGPGRNICS